MTTVQIFIKIAFFVNQIMYGKAHTLTAFKVKWYENLRIKNLSARCRGLSRGLHYNAPMQSTPFGSSKPARKTAGKQQGGPSVHPRPTP